jgi:hypothetical protein
VTNLETIDILALSAITGGGNSTSWLHLNEHVSTKSGFQNITKSASSQTSDYDTCVKAVSGMSGSTASDISSVCGARSGTTSASTAPGVGTSNRL